MLFQNPKIKESSTFNLNFKAFLCASKLQKKKKCVQKTKKKCFLFPMYQRMRDKIGNHSRSMQLNKMQN